MFIETILAVSLVLLVSGILYRRWRDQRVDVTRKAVVITGCDSGFGNALARRLDNLGVKVFAGCLFASGEGAKRLLEETGNVEVLQLDVTRDEDVRKAKEAIEKGVGNEDLWGLVNNAGVLDFAEFEYLPLKTVIKTIDVNLIGQIRMCKALLPELRKSHGRIVNVASLAGRIGLSSFSAYAASKFGVIGYSESLRLEVKMFGVRVITIEPGGYKTNIMSLSTIQKEFEKFFDQSTEEIRATYGHVAIDRFQKRANNSRMSSDITEVIDAMEHALLSQHPNTRYVPRLAERIAVNILTTIPYSMREYVLSRMYKYQDKKS